MRPSQPRLVVLCLSVAFLVALAVHATSAPVDLSPNSLNFGSQVVGSTSGVSTVNVTIPFGRQQQFAATGHFKNGSSADLTTSVTWTSSVPTVATISNSIGSQGLATSAKQGTTTIMATLGSLVTSTSLTVNPPPSLVSITVS